MSAEIGYGADRVVYGSDRGDRVRCLVSICAAAVGVLIAIHQDHFTIELDQPSSFYVMTMHRCGVMMMAAIGWMMVECGALGWRSR